jgi:hypothetical protein
MAEKTTILAQWANRSLSFPLSGPLVQHPSFEPDTTCDFTQMHNAFLQNDFLTFTMPHVDAPNERCIALLHG